MHSDDASLDEQVSSESSQDGDGNEDELDDLVNDSVKSSARKTKSIQSQWYRWRWRRRHISSCSIIPTIVSCKCSQCLTLILSLMTIAMQSQRCAAVLLKPPPFLCPPGHIFSRISGDFRSKINFLNRGDNIDGFAILSGATSSPYFVFVLTWVTRTGYAPS